MENQQILNLLNEASNSKFVTKKWDIVGENSKEDYNEANEITYNTKVLCLILNLMLVIATMLTF